MAHTEAGILLYVVFIIYASAAFSARASSTILQQTHGLAHQFPFPGVMARLLESVLRIWMVVHYMLFPPTVPEPRELLERDTAGVYRRKKRVRPTANNAIGMNNVLEFWVLILFTLL